MASGSFTLDDAHVAILVFGGFMVAVYHTSEPGKASFRAGVAALLWQAFGVVCASGLPPGPGVMLHAKRAALAPKSRTVRASWTRRCSSPLLPRADVGREQARAGYAARAHS